MKLNNTELYQLFVEKDILYLHHANTVSTSITFIQNGGLLSRGVVERSGLHQSPQSSDNIDKAFNVWNDIFFDTIDLHGYFPRQNFYGPVVFKYSVDVILDERFEIWITKDNPINWEPNMTTEQKYFSGVDELRADWNNYPRQRKMVTLRNYPYAVPFDLVHQVVVDDPRVNIGDVTLFNETVKGLRGVSDENQLLRNKFYTRQCNNCFCRSNYLHQVNVNDLTRLFLPQNLSI